MFKVIGRCMSLSVKRVVVTLTLIDYYYARFPGHIPAERLSVISFGKEKPADSGHDGAAWARNRRDEFAVESN
jgi:hypothetical protein